MRALRRSASRRATPGDERRRRAPAAPRSARARGSRRQRRQRARSRTAPDDRPSEHEVDERQRLRPLLDEAQARVDHRRALARAARRRRWRRAAARGAPQRRRPVARRASHHSATRAMNAGSTITSRDSHDVRHIAAARQARSGRPRWRNERRRGRPRAWRARRASIAASEGGASGKAAEQRERRARRRGLAPRRPAVVKKTTENAGFTSASAGSSPARCRSDARSACPRPR